jgi:hypothetical protein
MDSRDDTTQGDFNLNASTGALEASNPSDLVDDSPENPTVSGLAAGGYGTSIDTGQDQTGGATGSGGGVVDRIGGTAVVGGETTGSLWSGTGIPPKGEDADEYEI